MFGCNSKVLTPHRRDGNMETCYGQPTSRPLRDSGTRHANIRDTIDEGRHNGRRTRPSGELATWERERRRWRTSYRYMWNTAVIRTSGQTQLDQKYDRTSCLLQVHRLMHRLNIELQIHSIVLMVFSKPLYTGHSWPELWLKYVFKTVDTLMQTKCNSEISGKRRFNSILSSPLYPMLWPLIESSWIDYKQENTT